MSNLQSVQVSVIVTTYNWPEALGAVLKALCAQKTQHAFEIIVADDGSREETAALVRAFKNQSSIPILHVWQPDEGFRAAAIRNKASLAAAGEYLIYLDGDCVPGIHFVERHYRLAEPHTFVVGNRLLLRESFTQTVLSQQWSLHEWSLMRWIKARFNGASNRIDSLLTLPLPRWLRFISKKQWQGVKGCNLSLWKKDLMQINGWEENFVGWGHEDADLAIRLIQSGVLRKQGRFQVPVFHLWHSENDRYRESENWKMLKSREAQHILMAEKGLNQYGS